MSALPARTRDFLTGLGITPGDDALWLEALTHGSFTGAPANYERLEFLGDRVLGLAIADGLFTVSGGAEGDLSQRLNVLVSRQTCARVARRIGLAPHIRMGKQALGDGGADSDNILGDVIEALLGAAFVESGFDAVRAIIAQLWAPEIKGDAGRAKHPKSALQEWAAGNQRKPPEYELVDRSGPDHAALFTVRVSVHRVGAVDATASSKQEAERLAAKKFMEQYG